MTVSGSATGNDKLDNAVTATASGRSMRRGGCVRHRGPGADAAGRQVGLARRRPVEGGVVTYTVTLTNTGAVDYTATAPASFSDDLSAVLDDASYLPGSATGGGVFSAPTLSWSGIQLAAGASKSFTYKVTVNTPDAGDHFLDNVVSTPPGLGSNCDAGSTDATCSTHTPVRSLHVTKTASATVASPGDTVTYTIVVTNTGAIDLRLDVAGILLG